MRILFGVSGYGMGHAIRSKVILNHLSKKHKVKVVCGGTAFSFLRKFFDCEEIGALRIKIYNNKVTNIGTFFYNLFLLPSIFYKSFKLFRIFNDFKPDIIINDFEPFTSYFSFLYNRKVICVDNQHITLNTKIDKVGNFFERFFGKLILNLFSIKKDYNLITTFFYPKIKEKNTFLFPPILRDEIIKSNAFYGNRILVYLSVDNEKLVSVLSKTNESFIVYGLNKNISEKNIEFRKFDEIKFIEDLSSCKAFICNGGFTAISEALYLRKPILSFPIEKHFEQILNAFYIEKLGYGSYGKKLDEKTVSFFLKKLDKYRINLLKYKKEDNRKILKKLDEIILNIV